MGTTDTTDRLYLAALETQGLGPVSAHDGGQESNVLGSQALRRVRKPWTRGLRGGVSAAYGPRSQIQNSRFPPLGNSFEPSASCRRQLALADTIQFVEERFSVAAGLVLTPCPVSNEPLAFEGGILEGTNPRAELFRNALYLRFQIQDSRFKTAQGGNLLQKTEHGPDFACGSTGNVEECKKFLVGSALEAFGDIIRNRNGRALDLVAQAALTSEAGSHRERVDLNGKLDTRLPDGKLFETFVDQCSPLESGILNPRWGGYDQITTEAELPSCQIFQGSALAPN